MPIRAPFAAATLFAAPLPWWQNALLLRLAIGLVLLLTAVFWQVRERALRRRQRQLEALVAERTRQLEAEKRELLAAREALRVQATRDELTQTWNRRALLGILEREASRCTRETTPLAVVLADLDHFKQVNDSHGHLAGDEVLRQVAARLTAAARPYDSVGRYVGEEFLLILPGLAPVAAPTRLEEFRLAVAAQPIYWHPELAPASAGPPAGTLSSLFQTCSFGVAWFQPGHPQPLTTALTQADQALYAAKRAGRNRAMLAALPPATAFAAKFPESL